MSRTKTPVREGADYYPTPGWAVQAILPHLDSYLRRDTEHLVLEPAAGDGAIVREVLRWRPCLVDTCEIRGALFTADSLLPSAERIGKLGRVGEGDFLGAGRSWYGYDVVLTNPPYKLAFEFVLKAVESINHHGIVVMLLRMGWLEAGGSPRTLEKAAWLRDHWPDLFLLQRRPSFMAGAGGNDSATYAWMVWRKHEKREGKLVLIPREEYR